MTTVTFHSADSRLDGFVVEGHSGYAEAGADRSEERRVGKEW